MEQHGADILVTVKGNAGEAHATLQGLRWAGAGYGAASGAWERGHGRWERHSIRTCAVPAGLLPFPHVRQALRVTRETATRPGVGVERAERYAVTSLPAAQAAPERLLALARGHWQVESGNHYRRDVTMREDGSRIRTGHGPSSNALLNNIALALLLRAGQRALPAAHIRYRAHPAEAVQLLTEAA